MRSSPSVIPKTHPTHALRYWTIYLDITCCICVVLKDQSWDYNFLSTSDTMFTKLKLSGTFSSGAGVYPEVLFNNVRLQPQMVHVSEDGVLSLSKHVQITETLVSMSLFGRVYSQDPDYPEQFCPVWYILSSIWNMYITCGTPLLCWRPFRLWKMFTRNCQWIFGALDGLFWKSIVSKILTESFLTKTILFILGAPKNFFDQKKFIDKLGSWSSQVLVWS